MVVNDSLLPLRIINEIGNGQRRFTNSDTTAATFVRGKKESERETCDQDLLMMLNTSWRQTFAARLSSVDVSL